MHLVRATRRILEAKQNITPKLVERCLSLDPGSLSYPTDQSLACTRSVAFPDCAGNFNIVCAVPGIADQYTTSLQIQPSKNSISTADAEALAERVIASLKEQYGRTRMRYLPDRTSGYIAYWSSLHFDRGVLHIFNFAKRDPNRRAFGGIMIANMHRGR